MQTGEDTEKLFSLIVDPGLALIPKIDVEPIEVINSREEGQQQMKKKNKSKRGKIREWKSREEIRGKTWPQTRLNLIHLSTDFEFHYNHINSKIINLI